MNEVILLPEVTLSRLETEKAVEKQNLKPWLFKKGQSGNPAGKPPGTISLTAIIKRKLNEIYKSEKTNPEKKEAIELLADRILENSIENGSERSQEKIWAYLDGQPKATLDIGADKESLSELTKFFIQAANPNKNES